MGVTCCTQHQSLLWTRDRRNRSSPSTHQVCCWWLPASTDSAQGNTDSYFILSARGQWDYKAMTWHDMERSDWLWFSVQTTSITCFNSAFISFIVEILKLKTSVLVCWLLLSFIEGRSTIRAVLTCLGALGPPSSWGLSLPFPFLPSAPFSLSLPSPPPSPPPPLLPPSVPSLPLPLEVGPLKSS